jgi:hypothetical protein
MKMINSRVKEYENRRDDNASLNYYFIIGLAERATDELNLVRESIKRRRRRHNCLTLNLRVSLPKPIETE